MPINVINWTTINVKRLNHKCNKLATTSCQGATNLPLSFFVKLTWNFLLDSLRRGSSSLKLATTSCQGATNLPLSFVVKLTWNFLLDSLRRGSSSLQPLKETKILFLRVKSYFHQHAKKLPSRPRHLLKFFFIWQLNSTNERDLLIMLKRNNI